MQQRRKLTGCEFEAVSQTAQRQRLGNCDKKDKRCQGYISEGDAGESRGDDI
jgi:hypothetical protein